MVDAVSKWFGGVVAVSDVSLVVEPGVTALLGPNGAGKHHALRTIGGLTLPSASGDLFGEPVRRNPALYRRIGYMPEHEAVYDFLTGRHLVALGARLQGVDDLDGAVSRAIETVDLVKDHGPPAARVLARMRQRMRLAATLVHDPPLLVLDEPLSGDRPRATAPPPGRDSAARRRGEDDPRLLAHPRGGRPRPTGSTHGERQARGQRRPGDSAEAQRPAVRREDRLRGRTRPRRRPPPVEAVESVEVADDGALRVRSRHVSSLQRSLPAIARESSTSGCHASSRSDDSLESVFEYLATGTGR